MSLFQLLKFKKWETRLFKMPRLEMPHFQTGTRVRVASGLSNLGIQSDHIMVKVVSK